jgi:hypothetical protein
MFRLGRYLRSRGRHIRLPSVFPELDRHMEIESLKKQFSEPDFTLSISSGGEYRIPGSKCPCSF